MNLSNLPPQIGPFSLLFFCCKSPTQYGAPSIYIQQLQKLSVHWTWMKKNRFTKNAASGSGCRAIKINETDFKDKNSPADASKCDKTQASSNTAAPATAHIVDTHRVTLSGDSTTTTWMLLNPPERGYAASLFAPVLSCATQTVEIELSFLLFFDYIPFNLMPRPNWWRRRQRARSGKRYRGHYRTGNAHRENHRAAEYS